MGVLAQDIKEVFASVCELKEYVVKMESERDEHRDERNKHGRLLKSVDAQHREVKALTENLETEFSGHRHRLDAAVGAMAIHDQGNSDRVSLQAHESLQQQVR